MDNYSEEIGIQYTVKRRNIKYPRLEFKTGHLELILPKNYKEENQLLQKHEKWIQPKIQQINEAKEQNQHKALKPERTTTKLKEQVTILVHNLATKLGTGTQKVLFRSMKTKWASHSRNETITVNTLLTYLPDDLIRYIIYHEIAHAKLGKKHNKDFWKLIDAEFDDRPTKEKELLSYWFLIQEKPEGKGSNAAINHTRDLYVPSGNKCDII